MRLNLGCGEKMLLGGDWLNVDIRKLYPNGATYIRHDATRIGDLVKDGHVHELVMDDVLEHLSLPEAKDLLATCYKLMAPGAKIRVKTPCVEDLIKFCQGRDVDEIALRWYGGNDYPENCHKYCWPEKSLVAYMRSIGFVKFRVEHAEMTNMIVTAVK